ncbi:ATP-grasp domain-containing protein [Ammoniphilus sp. CFH 90114]|uniref:ATP-grasp domain-containing protein n=1 Tax=Ammoniphilus sp. CFH 90114 TaxID=2493665 RepID=UPI00100E7C20|nr:ATP-grasp domain-containing protein [Ammoniphilus sp. CFH 90114]RXT03678.1 ATP-grasp domain-containing protein [Ammoniphilus sp. CFH 90114]
MIRDKKKILVLGAGRDQLPIINKAKELGLFVIVVSPKGEYDGFKIADKIFYADITEIDEILEFAKSEGVDGVVSDQLDIAVPSIAYITEMLNLPGIGYDCSQYFTNKNLMRNVAEEVGIPIPRYKEVEDLNSGLGVANDIGFPVVIKPVDSAGSKGVFKVDSEDEFREKFKLAKVESFSRKVMVEDFIQGEQYLSRGYVDEYKLRLFAFADRYYFDLPKNFLPNITIFPATVEKNIQMRMVDYHDRLIKKLRPKFGATGSEWIYNRDTDTLYLVEISIRGGGAFISSDLIPEAYGIDLQPYLINASLNQKNSDVFSANIKNRSSAYVFFLLPEGRVCDVSGLNEIESIEGVLKSFVRNIKVGEIIKSINHKGSRIGPILVSGDTRDEVEMTIKEIQSKVTVNVETDCGKKGIIWK